MASTTKSSRSHKNNGTLLPPSEQGVAPHLILTDKKYFKVLLVMYMTLLKNTYSPEVITLSMFSAQKVCQELGLEEDFLEAAEKVQEYWDNNRMFKGFF